MFNQNTETQATSAKEIITTIINLQAETINVYAGSGDRLPE